MKKELSAQNIILDLKAEDKMTALREVAVSMALHTKLSEEQKSVVIDGLTARESTTTFAVGHSIAIPHLACESLDNFVFFYARSLEGIDFDACDHGLVHHLFFVLIPEEQKCGWLKILAKMAKTLSDYELREELMQFSEASHVSRLLTARLFAEED